MIKFFTALFDIFFAIASPAIAKEKIFDNCPVDTIVAPATALPGVQDSWATSMEVDWKDGKSIATAMLAPTELSGEYQLVLMFDNEPSTCYTAMAAVEGNTIIFDLPDVGVNVTFAPDAEVGKGLTMTITPSLGIAEFHEA